VKTVSVTKKYQRVTEVYLHSLKVTSTSFAVLKLTTKLMNEVHPTCNNQKLKKNI